MGDRPMAGLRTLTPSIKVRILVTQPNNQHGKDFLSLYRRSFFKNDMLLTLHTRRPRSKTDFMKSLFIFLAMFIFFASTQCWASPAIIYIGKAQDSAYNHSLHDGIQEFQEKTGHTCVEIETPSDASKYLSALLDCVAKKYSPIILPYSDQFPEIVPVIHKNKDLDFILLDHGDVDKSNVYSFSFADQEGSFMAGALAALMSKTKIVGFIYTSDQYPVLLRFRSGYIQGCQTVDPEVKVLEAQLGDYPEAWRDTNKSRKVAEDMIAQGADVLFAAAGFAGTGMLDQAAEKNIYAIGVDSNQNHLHPGTMIGSMVKRSDKAIFIALKLAFAKIRRDGIKRLGVAQNAVGIDFEGVQKNLVPESVKQKLHKLKSEIALGKRKLKETLPKPAEK